MYRTNARPTTHRTPASGSVTTRTGAPAINTRSDTSVSTPAAGSPTTPAGSSTATTPSPAAKPVTRRQAIKTSMGAAFSLSAMGLAACSSSSSGSDSGSSTSSGSSSSSSSATATSDIAVNTVTSATVSTELVGQDEQDIKAWIKETLYDVDVQAQIAAELDEVKEAAGYTLASPLVYYNPFGTNTLGLYVYFETDDACSITYTVTPPEDTEITLGDQTVSSSEIAAFTRAASSGESTTEHEFQVIGLVPNALNTITLDAAFDDGTTESVSFTYEAGGVLNDEELQLEVEEGSSTSDLADGLYVILGNDGTDTDGLRCMYYYDNDGILRTEIPIYNYRSHRLLFDGDIMYFSLSQTWMAAMNGVGQIVNVYKLSDYDYELHHDYVFDSDGNILVLATYTGTNETVEDMIVKLDPATGDVELALDMGDLMPDYKAEAIAYHEENYEAIENDQGDESDDDGVDWIHLNTIQWLGDGTGSIIVSSRETSTIIKISDLYGTPAIEYMLCSKDFWEGTDYEQYGFDQVGDFVVQGGQHTVTYIEDESLDEGQYYLIMYNNNIGVSEAVTNGFDYDAAGLTNEDAVSDTVESYYYKYLVDENARTFELVDEIGCPLSGYVSSVQDVDGNILIDSGIPGIFAEYDAEGEPIATFTMHTDKFIYRVFKYDL